MRAHPRSAEPSWKAGADRYHAAATARAARHERTRLLPLAVAVAAALHLAAAASPPPSGASAADARGGIDARRQAAERRDQALFEQKCGKCHALAVATSTPLTVVQMKRHLRRPGLAVSQAQLQRIADLLKDAERRASQ